MTALLHIHEYFFAFVKSSRSERIKSITAGTKPVCAGIRVCAICDGGSMFLLAAKAGATL